MDKWKIIIEALEFERDHWQERFERKRPARKSAIKVWMQQRILHLNDVIGQVRQSHEPVEMTDEDKADQWWQSNTHG